MENRSFSMWQNKPFVIFFGMIGIVSTAIIFIGGKMYLFYDQLASQGIAVTGVVTHEEVRPGSRWGSNHYYFYQYTDKTGRIHSGKTAIQKLKVGASITVTYLPQKPARHVPFPMSPKRAMQPLQDAFKFSFASLFITYLFGRVVFWCLRR